MLPASLFNEILDGHALKRLGSFSDFLNIGKGLGEADCRRDGSNNGCDLTPQCNPICSPLLAHSTSSESFCLASDKPTERIVIPYLFIDRLA